MIMVSWLSVVLTRFGDRQGVRRGLNDYRHTAVIAATLYHACDPIPQDNLRHTQSAIDSLNDLDRICNVFSTCDVLVFGEARDKCTGSRVRTWAAQKDHRRYIELHGHQPTGGLRERVQRLSHTRNQVLNVVQQMSRDYTIMADADGLLFRPASSVAAAMMDTDQWDVVTFNRVRNEGYYDTWAFRMPDVLNYYNSYGGIGHPATKRLIGARIKPLPESGYLRVLSAGNGFIMYKSSFMRGCRYDWRAYEIPSSTDYDCEHAVYNHCVTGKNGARIVISKRELG